MNTKQRLHELVDEWWTQQPVAIELNAAFRRARQYQGE